MKVKNNLKILMAKHDINNVAKLARLTGLNYQTLRSFYHQRYEVFNGPLIATLCEFFECQIGDLLQLEKVS
ncbi:helix-turn-helix transcriptional regulator [Niallia taxi]|uniref:helix-turn-helix domain-containing protein n=1 Tax=Niallia taxi TaxID=2499688 RepID=UPI003173D3B7